MKRVTIAMFQNYGSIFENIGKNDALRTELAEYGYDNAELDKGRALYEAALQQLDINKTETAEEKLAYDAFSKQLDELKSTYATDRKKVKIVYKDQAAVLSSLGVKGITSIRTTELINGMDTLYKQLSGNEQLLQPLAKLKITNAHVATQLQRLEEVKTAYNTYIKEKGESQQATKDKDKALTELEKWVRELYAIAKIALEDKPQLLESIGKFVRS